MREIIFSWHAPSFSKPDSAQVCNVEGVGKLYAKREKQGSNLFEGYINGKIIVRQSSMLDAKVCLEQVAAERVRAVMPGLSKKKKG